MFQLSGFYCINKGISQNRRFQRELKGYGGITKG